MPTGMCPAYYACQRALSRGVPFRRARRPAVPVSTRYDRRLPRPSSIRRFASGGRNRGRMSLEARPDPDAFEQGLDRDGLAGGEEAVGRVGVGAVDDELA